MNTENQQEVTRSMVTLLGYVYDEMPNLSLGLCSLVNGMFKEGKINLAEKQLLISAFYRHRPTAGMAHFWKIGIIEPRLKFLQELIIKYSSETNNQPK